MHEIFSGGLFLAYGMLALDGAWSRWDTEGIHDHDSPKGLYDIPVLVIRHETALYDFKDKIGIDGWIRMEYLTRTFRIFLRTDHEKIIFSSFHISSTTWLQARIFTVYGCT